MFAAERLPNMRRLTGGGGGALRQADYKGLDRLKAKAPARGEGAA
jgi:hypothetical protein